MKKFTASLKLILILSVLFSCTEISAQQILPKPKRIDNFSFPKLPSAVPVTDNMYNVVQDDFLLQLRDGVHLDCSKFYPDAPNPYLTNGYPVVIMVHGYGDRKETLQHFALAQAQYNYVVYTFSVRGQGNSEGLSDLISITEAQDLIEFVNYVKADNVGGDSSKIMIMGGSQGGTLPYMAASNGMKVAGIISALTSPQFASSWIENGSVKTTFLWTIEYTPDSARYTPLVDRMSDWVYATGVKSNLWDSLEINVPRNRDFADKIHQNTVPVLIENSWQDYFFNARQGLNTLSSLTFPFRTYFGAVMGHGGDISVTENNWHMNFFNEWFYYYIWDVNNELPTRPKFHFAYTTFPRVGQYWDFKHDSSSVWPIQGVQNVKFYMRTNKKLSLSNENGNKKVEFDNKVTSGYTLMDAVYAEFRGADFDAKFKKDSVYFDSDPVSAPTKMIGTPRINLNYSSNADICQYNFHFYEVRSNGDVKFINRINYTDRKYVKNSKREKLIEGISHAHILSSGSKLRVVVTNLDRTADDFKFLETNPHVLPVMTNSKNTIWVKDSYLEIPLVTVGSNMAGMFDPTVEPKLHQNYPNPFNPSTNIKFEIPEGIEGLASLKIYDIAGREVATLVNEQVTAGLHEFTWNAINISSGVYFYKLVVGQHTDIKRMLLIK